MGDGLETGETGDGSLSPFHEKGDKEPSPVSKEPSPVSRKLSPNRPQSPKNPLYMLHKRDTRSIIKLNEMPFCI